MEYTHTPVMLPRFLATDLDPVRAVATLTDGEAHHLTRVLRLGAGDRVAVFDGRGQEFEARIDRITGGTVALKLDAQVASAPERQVTLTLAQAVLKGSSMDDVVRDATTMGVSSIVPIVTEYTIAKRAASAHSAERWWRVAVASAKQCRRARVPDVEKPVEFDEFVQRAREGTRLLLVEPSLRSVEPVTVRTLPPNPGTATLMVGPEGGWADEEVRAAVSAGSVPLTLGPMTLRADAAAFAALAALSVVWD
jgi:16S rRNA (uracil1498-N3)-methyltransferase